MNRRTRNEDSSEDDPVYSRLFIVCEKRFTENDFRDAFCHYGTIEDIHVPRNRTTGEPKGVAYIKFSRTSEAADALEAMNMNILKEWSRPLKVMVAANRSEIPSDDKYTRLFLTVAKSTTQQELRDIFSAYGHIDSLQIQTDRNSGAPTGFAYVKYRKFSEAARAFEECDRKFRAIFATPKGQTKRSETAFESNINSLANTSNLTSMMSSISRPNGYTKVNFICSPHLTQMHTESVFDIVPGMVRCEYLVDLVRNYGKGTVTYSNPIAAAYAVEKLNEFEYPPGVKMFVKPDNSRFDDHGSNFSNVSNVTNNLKNAIQSAAGSSVPDLAQLADAIAEASKLVKIATAGVKDEYDPNSNNINYCSVKLPPPKDLADIDSPVAKRCFLVCKPQPPPLTVLRDVFCRFGDLINVYTLPNKIVGFARYASEQAANDAIKTLHGAEICGVRMKVLEAEEEAYPKKRRMSDS